MAPDRLDNQALLTELALIFPKDSFAELGRNFAHAHEQAWNDIKSNSMIRSADRPNAIGQIRRSYVNTEFYNFSEQVGWNVEEVKMGSGHDNHVEVQAGKRLLVTCHHLSNGQRLPKKAKYLEQNWELNDLLSQGELFSMEEVMMKKQSPNIFNLLILYTTDTDFPSQIGDIDFVFASGNRELARFSITDVIRHQQWIHNLPEDALLEIKDRFEYFKKRA